MLGGQNASALELARSLLGADPQPQPAAQAAAKPLKNGPSVKKRSVS